MKNSESNRELVISRIFNVPIALMWKVWTEPAHVVQWWGPTGFTNTIHEMDLRPGGVWHHTMHGPDGKNYKNNSVFTKVEKPTLLSFTHLTAPKFENIIAFEDLDGKTKVTMTMRFETQADHDMAVHTFGAKEGNKQHFDSLENYLPGLITL